MKRKVVVMFLGVFFAGMIYSGMCLACMACHNSISEEDYARMAQELVEQSIQP